MGGGVGMGPRALSSPLLQSDDAAVAPSMGSMRFSVSLNEDQLMASAAPNASLPAAAATATAATTTTTQQAQQAQQQQQQQRRPGRMRFALAFRRNRETVLWLHRV